MKTLGISLLAVGLIIIGLQMYSYVRPEAKTAPLIPASSPPVTAPSPSVQTKVVIVPANQPWFDTGIDVAGKTIQVTYMSGRWANTPGHDAIFSDGFGSGTWPDLVLPSAPFRALIARVGSQVFFVGNRWQGQAGSGRLYLAMNDKVNTYDDNQGSLTVEIQSY